MSEFSHQLASIFSKENFGQVLSLIAVVCLIATICLTLDNYTYGFIKSLKIERQIYEFSQLANIKKNNPYIDKDPELQSIFYQLIRKIDSEHSSSRSIKVFEYSSHYSPEKNYSCMIQGNQESSASWQTLGIIFLLWTLTALIINADSSSTLGTTLFCISLGLIMLILAYTMRLPTIINPIADGIVFFTFTPIGLLIIFSKLKNSQNPRTPQ